MRHLLTLAAFLFFSLLTGHGEDTAQTTLREKVLVGGRIIKLPAPVGYHRMDGLDPKSDRMADDMMPANRYLARFDPPKNGAPELGRSFNVQVSRALEKQEIGDRDFEDIKKQMKAEMAKSEETSRKVTAQVNETASKALKDVIDTDAALSVSDVVVMGCFDDTPSSLGFTMVMNVDAKTGNKTGKAKMLVAGITLPVNGRLLYLYANAGFHSEADRVWAEKAVSAWRDVILAANPRAEDSAASFSMFDESSLAGLIVAGGVATVIVLLFIKKRA